MFFYGIAGKLGHVAILPAFVGWGGRWGRVWVIVLQYPHSYDETHRKHYFTPVSCRDVSLLRSNPPIYAQAWLSHGRMIGYINYVMLFKHD